MSLASFPACSAATCAAKGVLFLEPLKPEPPAVFQNKDSKTDPDKPKPFKEPVPSNFAGHSIAFGR